MTRKPSNQYPWLYLLVPVFLACIATIVSGCGGEEEEPESVAPAQTTPSTGSAPEDEALPDTAPPDLAMGEVIPETLSALQFLPADAQMAVALPPVPGILAKVSPLLKAIAPPDEDVDEELSEFFRELGEDIGVEAESFEQLAAGLGVDREAAMGIFADFAPAVASAAAAKAEADASGAVAPDDAAYEGVDYFEDADPPALVGVFRVTDPDRAVSELERIVAQDEGLSALPAGTEEVGGITITTRGDYGYFLARGHIAVGNVSLLRGTASRVSNPATFRYGTVECPAAASDEIVTLIYGSRVLPLLEQALPLFGPEEDLAPLAAAQYQMYKGAFHAENEDPIVGTLTMNDDRIEMLWRVDTAVHPGLMEMTGPAQPLRLARYLPESTLALVSFRFNEEFKKQLLEDVLPSASATSDPAAGMNLVYATQFLTQLGDEATIGIASAAAGLPEAYIMLGLAEPEATQGLVQMFGVLKVLEEVEGVTIYQVNVEGMSPVPVFLSFVDNFVVASNSDAGLRTVVKRHKAGEVSGFFAALEPPFNIDTPRYQAAVIKSRIVSEVYGVAAMFVPGAAVDPEIQPLLTAIREVRTGKELSGTWLQGRATVYLGDLAAAAALRDALPASPAEAPVAGETTPAL